MKTLLKLIAVIALLFVVVAIAAFFWTKNYIKSDEFRSFLSGEASSSLEGEVVIQKLNVDNWSIQTEGVELKNGNGLQAIQISNFSGGVAPLAVLNKTWKITGLTADSLHVVVGDKEKKQQKKQKKREAVPPVVKTSKKTEFKSKKESVKKDDFFKSLVPNKLELGELKVKEVSGLVQRKGKDFRWEGISVEAKGSDEKIEAKLSGGIVHIPVKLVPVWKPVEVNLELTEERFDIKSAVLNGVGNSELKLTGTGDFSGDDLNLKGNFKDLPVQDLLKKKWKERLSGTLETNFVVTGGGKEIKVDGDLKLEGGVLKNLPFLSKIEKFTGDSRYTSLELDVFQSKVTHLRDKLQLNEIEIESKGLLKLVGNFELEDETYVADLSIGFPESTLSKVPGLKLSSLKFVDGYFWTPLKMSGLEDEFTNDLTAKIINSVLNKLLENNDVLNELSEKASKLFGDKVDVNKGVEKLMQFFKKK